MSIPIFSKSEEKIKKKHFFSINFDKKPRKEGKYRHYKIKRKGLLQWTCSHSRYRSPTRRGTAGRRTVSSLLRTVPVQVPGSEIPSRKMRDQGDSIFRRGGKCLAFGATLPTLLVFLGGASHPFKSPASKKSTCNASAFWCDQGDLNPHGCPYAPQTYASACSAMIANDNDYNIGLPEFCQALKRIFL